MTTGLSRAPALALALTLSPLVLAPALAGAQVRRAAIVVRGDAVDAARAREPVQGALTALGYEVLSAESVEAAIAFAPAGDDEALRVALGAETLAVIETRPASDAEVFVSVTRLSAAGRQQQFGRTAAADAGGFALAQLVEWERSAQATPPAVVAPAVAGAAPPGVGSQGAPTPAATSTPATAAAPATATTLTPVPVLARRPVGMPNGAEQPHPGAGLMAPGLGGLLFGIVGWILTPILASTAMCPYRYPSCETYAALGVIPFAGPWLVLDSPPGHAWDDGQEALLVTLGVAQVVLIPLGAVLLAIGATRRAPAEPQGPRFSLDVAPAPGGALVTARGSF